MATNEDYLDSLLQAAMNPNHNEETKNDSDSLSALENINNESTSVSVDPNKTLSPDEIAAMFAAAEAPATEETTIEESISENIAVEDPIVEEPVAEESIVEEPIIEEPIAEPESVDFDPNKTLSPDEIAAMFAAAETPVVEELAIEEPITENVTVEEPVAEEPVAEEPVAEEPIAEPESAEFDPNKTLSPDEIEAMFAAAEAQTIEDSANEETLEENDSSSDLDELLSELEDDHEKTFDEALTEIEESLGLNDIPEEEEKQIEEELEFDLDGIDDIDALLGLKEMPDNYKDEMRQEKEEKKSEEETMNLEDQDLTDILDMLSGDDSELAEINDILKKSDNNEVVDSDSIDDLLADLTEDNTLSNTEDSQEESVDEEVDKKKKKKSKKSKKSKNNEVTEAESADGENVEPVEKKPGFFSKLFNALTEEIEDEEESENAEKKEKKKKGKKKGKGDATSNEELLEEMDAEDAIQEKKKKKEKKEKKKKEKKIKEIKVVEPEEKGKKLPMKMVLLIFVLCFSILGVVILINTFMPDITSLKKARSMFYSGKYSESYQELSSHSSLSESDNILYCKAKHLATMEEKISMYNAYIKADMQLEALNSLIEGVSYYHANAEEFVLYGIVYEVESLYEQIMRLIDQQWGLSEEQVYQITLLEKVDYTHILRQIIGTEKKENPILFLGKSDAQNDTVSENTIIDVNALDDPLDAELE